MKNQIKAKLIVKSLIWSDCISKAFATLTDPAQKLIAEKDLIRWLTRLALRGISYGLQQHHCVCGNALFATGKTQILCGCRFDINDVDANFQVISYMVTHSTDV